ncbi:type II secretion system F family protein [Pseudodesulfovibrio pelocollis]|uniref:type II secretion system F family protein n=1 Tax=Pseudodesulfovibrio pelocollis TaxID=3051432 RepID=UPI00255A8C13|nr:type II secretion system F family protein [Pseudodesulfovibrio sp. SB368]
MDSALIPLIAAGLAFATVLVAGLGVVAYLGGAGQAARLREQMAPDRSAPDGSVSAGRGRSLSGDLRRAVRGFFEGLGSRVAPRDADEANRVRRALVQAGLRSSGAVTIFQGTKAVLALGLPALFLGARLLGLVEMSVALTCFVAVGLAALGVYGPELWIRRRIRKRQLAVANELPDALDLLVVCVESGMGLDQALDRVCLETRTSGPVISAELKLLTLELRAGKGRGDALRALADRVGLDDLNSLTSLLVQADIFGISVGRTLRVYSDAMRTKRSQRAEERAAKLPVLLLLPLVGFILPALFVAIMGPAVILFIDVFARIEM